MRHKRKRDSLGLATDQQKALLKSLMISILEHGHIVTTLTKAKVLRTKIEPLITKAIKANEAKDPIEKLHYIRLIRRIMPEYMIKTSLERVATVKSRTGGYTRIVKLPYVRRGDNREKAMIEIICN